MVKIIKLHIETDKDTYQVGDDVTVQVRDEKGNPVAGVTVQTTGITDKTDKTGKTAITFRQTGNIDLTADKPNTQNVSYVADRKTVQVTRKNIELHIETDKDTYQVGDDITVQVRDENGNPVEGVTVQSSTGIAATTDAKGETTIIIQQTDIQQTEIIDLESHKADTENITYISYIVRVAVKSS